VNDARSSLYAKQEGSLPGVRARVRAWGLLRSVISSPLRPVSPHTRGLARARERVEGAKRVGENFPCPRGGRRGEEEESVNPSNEDQ